MRCRGAQRAWRRTRASAGFARRPCPNGRARCVWTSHSALTADQLARRRQAPMAAFAVLTGTVSATGTRHRGRQDGRHRRCCRRRPGRPGRACRGGQAGADRLHSPGSPGDAAESATVVRCTLREPRRYPDPLQHWRPPPVRAVRADPDLAAMALGHRRAGVASLDRRCRRRRLARARSDAAGRNSIVDIPAGGDRSSGPRKPVAVVVVSRPRAGHLQPHLPSRWPLASDRTWSLQPDGKLSLWPADPGPGLPLQSGGTFLGVIGGPLACVRDTRRARPPWTSADFAAAAVAGGPATRRHLRWDNAP